DGTRLYGMMQSALIQDGALNYATNPPSRIGTNNRIVEINLVTGAIREFLYQLDSASNGVYEILAVNDHEFLVIERDGRAGASAAFKRSFGSTSRTRPTRPPTFEGFPSCRRTGTPVGVTPVAKFAFINLLDPIFGLAPSASFPEKIEGLAFG